MMKSHTIELTSCTHCGESCGENPVFAQDLPFCCTGCANVYQILQTQEETCEAGSSVTAPKKSKRSRFDYLEDTEVQDKLTDFNTENTAQITFRIPNIHCTSCVWLLEDLNNLDEGVISSRVQFMKRELTVQYNKATTTLRNLVELLTSMGYEPSLTLEQLDEKTVSGSTNKRLLLKLGLAGFAFGNIMLFSFPDYLSSDESLVGLSFATLFGILNIVLSIPVLVYSASDYLKSAWSAILQKGINLDVPISIGIIALFSRSLYEIITATGTGYFDSFTGLIFFLLIGKWVQKISFDRFSFNKDYKAYLPISVRIKRNDGTESSLAIEQLELGQEIIVRNEELVPVDAILESDESYIDYSFLTGESEPIHLNKGDLVYAGGKIIGQKANLIVYKQADHSYLTQLWNNEAFKTDKRQAITSFANKISPYFTISVLGIAIVSGLYWYTQDAATAISVFTAVLIVACPCALALSTPFTLNAVSQIFALNGFFVKSTEVLEELSATDTIVFDKTGTVTQSGQQGIQYVGKSLHEDEWEMVKLLCLNSAHPISDTIADSIKANPDYVFEAFSEVVNRGGTASHNEHTISLGTIDYFQDNGIEIQDDQTLGTKLYLSIDNEVKGYFLIENQIRKGIVEILRDFSQTFKTYLLSGDTDKHKDHFREFFNDETHLLFHQSPQDKLDFINGLQSNEHHVCMIGDGINDAGALKQADFGVAVNDDVNAFTPACDAILEGSSMHKLQTFMSFSKSAMKIILLSFFISLLYNTAGLYFAVTAQLSPLIAAILMPLSSVSIMIFTYSASTLTAKKKGLALWK